MNNSLFICPIFVLVFKSVKKTPYSSDRKIIIIKYASTNTLFLYHLCLLSPKPNSLMGNQHELIPQGCVDASIWTLLQNLT